MKRLFAARALFSFRFARSSQWAAHLLLSLLFLLIALPAVASQSTASQPPRVHLSETEKAWISQHPVIRFGFDSEFVPFEFYGPENRFQGMAADYLALIEQRLGLTFEPVTGLKWKEVVEMARNRRIDLLPCVGTTEERRTFLNFSSPYLAFPRVFITRNDSGAISMNDLNGVRVAVQVNSSHHGFLKENTTIVPLLYDTFQEALQAVSSGEADALIGNLAVSVYTIREQGLANLKVAGHTSRQSFPLSMATRNDWPMLGQLIDKALASLTHREKAEINRRWIPLQENRSYEAIQETLTPEEHAWLARHPTIRVGVDKAYAPYSFQDDQGAYHGVAMEFLDRISAILGIDFQVVPDLGWPQIIDGARDKSLDLIATAVRTEERTTFLNFSQIYIPTPLVIMARSDDHRFQGPDDLDQATVALVEKYSSSQRVIKEHPSADTLGVATPLAGLQAVSVGEADAYVGVLGINVFQANKHGITNLKVAARYDMQTNGQRYGVRKDWPELASLLDKAITVMAEEEKTAILQKWIPILADTAGDDQAATISLTDEEKRWIEAHPLIRLGVDPEFVPFEYFDDKGVYIGIASDYVALLNQRLGLNMRVVPDLSWQQAMTKIRQKELDVLPCIGKNRQRQQIIDFSNSYIRYHLVIITRNNAPFIMGLENLENMRVTVQANTAYQGFLSEESTIEPLLSPTLHEGLIAVSTGKADALISDIASATYWIRTLNLTNLKVAAPASQQMQTLHFGVRKDWPLLVTILNKGLASISKEDENRIMNRWVSVQYKRGVEPEVIKRYAIRISIGVLVVLAIVFLWSYSLKREINQRKNAQQALVKAMHAAEAANSAKSLFLTNMSHELRTPMNAILGFAQLLERDPTLPQTARDNLKIIARSGDHLLSLINDVLDMSKIEAGKVTLENEVFDLHLLLENISDLFSSRAASKGLQFLMEKDEALPRFLKGDSAKLRQILINLIGNGLKFTEQGGVCLRLCQGAPQDKYGPGSITLHFEIEDSGVGIAPKEQKNIFQPFVQAGPSKDGISEGTGLGLAITRQFVQLMGGEISVKSEPGKGAVFLFDLVMETSPHPPQPEAMPVQLLTSLAPGQPSYKVLIVEDWPDNRSLLKTLLEKCGFTVLEAENGKQGVDLFHSWQPDLIWMDIRMPVMDGYEATRLIKATPQGLKTPVIALTASAFDNQRSEVLAAGCDDFVRKPFKESDIRHCLEKHIGASFVRDGAEEAPALPQPVRSEKKSESLATEAFDCLEDAHRQGLAQAALRLKGDECLAVIAQLPPSQASQAKALTSLVQAFRFDTIYTIVTSKENDGSGTNKPQS